MVVPVCAFPTRSWLHKAPRVDLLAVYIRCRPYHHASSRIRRLVCIRRPSWVKANVVTFTTNNVGEPRLVRHLMERLLQFSNLCLHNLLSLAVGYSAAEDNDSIGELSHMFPVFPETLDYHVPEVRDRLPRNCQRELKCTAY